MQIRLLQLRCLQTCHCHPNRICLCATPVPTLLYHPNMSPSGFSIQPSPKRSYKNPHKTSKNLSLSWGSSIGSITNTILITPVVFQTPTARNPLSLFTKCPHNRLPRPYKNSQYLRRPVVSIFQALKWKRIAANYSSQEALSPRP